MIVYEYPWTKRKVHRTASHFSRTVAKRPPESYGRVYRTARLWFCRLTNPSSVHWAISAHWQARQRAKDVQRLRNRRIGFDKRCSVEIFFVVSRWKIPRSSNICKAGTSIFRLRNGFVKKSIIAWKTNRISQSAFRTIGEVTNCGTDIFRGNCHQRIFCKKNRSILGHFINASLHSR